MHRREVCAAIQCRDLHGHACKARCRDLLRQQLALQPLAVGRSRSEVNLGHHRLGIQSEREPERLPHYQGHRFALLRDQCHREFLGNHKYQRRQTRLVVARWRLIQRVIRSCGGKQLNLQLKSSLGHECRQTREVQERASSSHHHVLLQQ